MEICLSYASFHTVSHHTSLGRVTGNVPLSQAARTCLSLGTVFALYHRSVLT